MYTIHVSSFHLPKTGFRRTNGKEEGRKQRDLGRYVDVSVRFLLKVGRHDVDVVNGAARGQDSRWFLRNWRPIPEMKQACQPNY